MKHIAKKAVPLVLIFCLMVFGVGPLAFAQEETDSDYEDYAPQTEQVFPRGPVSYFAKANVSDNGVISAATNVLSVQWNSTYSFWVIGLRNAYYYYLDYVTVVSTVGAGTTAKFRSATYDSVSGQLIVATWEEGYKVKKGFSFVVLK